MLNKEMKVGFNSHRLVEGDPYYAEEINFVEKINDEMKFSTDMLAGIVRHGERTAYNYLTEDEEKIVMSVIQWLGTPVGIGFLAKCGYVKEDKVSVGYTEKEVDKLLQVQRENCYVALLLETKNEDLAKIVNDAPEPIFGDWRK